MNGATLVAIAYLLGSIPTAVWISRLFFGIDIRDHGSKNMGASNTFRVLGSFWGIVVLLIDMGKGIAAVQLYRWLQSSTWMSHEIHFWQLMLGLTAVLGHIFPVFAGFKGGKGVATLFGVVIAIQPWIALISVLSFLLVVALTRYISLGSIAGVLVFLGCVLFVFKEENIFIRWFSGISALVVVFMHRSNLARLVKGTENKFKFKNRQKRN
ncbi:MAG: glycerol-3-phosphate 1-O-acyltransferase PlsY [Lacibacter sp.]